MVRQALPSTGSEPALSLPKGQTLSDHLRARGLPLDDLKDLAALYAHLNIFLEHGQINVQLSLEIS